jgi:hypothetical protein
MSHGSPQVDAVYIHKVQPVEKTYGHGNPDIWRSLGIVFVDTYIDAAVHAATVGSHASAPRRTAPRPPHPPP